MAVTVTIADHGPGRSRQLDARQTDMLLAELRRVRGGPLKRMLNGLLARSTHPMRVAPEMVITIHDGATTTEYEIAGGWLLRRRGERAVYPFYFALLLMEWLSGRNP